MNADLIIEEHRRLSRMVNVSSEHPFGDGARIVEMWLAHDEGGPVETTAIAILDCQVAAPGSPLALALAEDADEGDRSDTLYVLLAWDPEPSLASQLHEYGLPAALGITVHLACGLPTVTDDEQASRILHSLAHLLAEGLLDPEPNDRYQHYAWNTAIAMGTVMVSDKHTLPTR